MQWVSREKSSWYTNISNKSLAGVSLGPFASHQTGYQAALFNEMITELFEFANYESEVAKHYEKALRRVLKYGVRVTFCASIDDQLVSIEACQNVFRFCLCHY